MATRPKDIGTAAETAVVRFLRTAGFPHAERRALTGALDQGDITGTPGIAWEVKGGQAAKTASDGQVAQWLAETETERLNARADIGILVMARAGCGPANTGRWWAVLPFLHVAPQVALAADTAALSIQPVRVHLATACRMLQVAGYGAPQGSIGAVPA